MNQNQLERQRLKTSKPVSKSAMVSKPKSKPENSIKANFFRYPLNQNFALYLPIKCRRLLPST